MKLAPSSLVLLSLLPSLALAGEPAASPEVQAIEARVNAELVTPLVTKEQERAKFSRARLPPRERRVRVTQATPSTDANGKAFFTFSIDSRFGAGWAKDDVVGCAYVDGELFVKRGEYRPASILLGKNVKPVAGACVPSKDSLAVR